VDDYHLSKGNIVDLFDKLESELHLYPHLIISAQDANVGKWGMARLWRGWMEKTATYMAARGSVMPLMIKPDGSWYHERPFNASDAHELFTATWLGCDKAGERLSWSKKGRDGKRAATKGERFDALRKHEQYCLDRGITLFIPRDSEYSQLQKEQEQ